MHDFALHYFKCTGRIRDMNGKIIAYNLFDTSKYAPNKVQRISADKLKEYIRDNYYSVSNLKLTADNRLILIDEKTGKEKADRDNSIEKVAYVDIDVTHNIYEISNELGAANVSLEFKSNCDVKSIHSKALMLGKEGLKPVVTDIYYMVNVNSNTKEVRLLILSPYKLKLPADCSKLFERHFCKSMDLRQLDTSDVTDMGLMFHRVHCDYLDISTFDTSKVERMYGMFRDCGIENIKYPKFNTSKVTDMCDMFNGMKTNTLDLSSMDTSNVTNMQAMFKGCKVAEIDVSHFNTSKVTDMSYMFCNAESSVIDVSNFDTSKVTDMCYMFSGTKSNILDVSHFNTYNVTTMAAMFKGSRVESLDLSSFDTANTTNLRFMFSDCKVKLLDLSEFIFNIRQLNFFWSMCVYCPVYIDNENYYKRYNSKGRECALGYLGNCDRGFSVMSHYSIEEIFSNCDAKIILDEYKFIRSVELVTDDEDDAADSIIKALSGHQIAFTSGKVYKGNELKKFYIENWR